MGKVLWLYYQYVKQCFLRNMGWSSDTLTTIIACKIDFTMRTPAWYDDDDDAMMIWYFIFIFCGQHDVVLMCMWRYIHWVICHAQRDLFILITFKYPSGHNMHWARLVILDYLFHDCYCDLIYHQVLVLSSWYVFITILLFRCCTFYHDPVTYISCCELIFTVSLTKTFFVLDSLYSYLGFLT